MPKVGTLLQFIGGGITRATFNGLLIGIFVVIFGVAPWQFFAETFRTGPAAWLGPLVAIVGLLIIGFSLWFNLWSKKQEAIDHLAEDMAWAINSLLNQNPRPSIKPEIDQWEAEYQAWCRKISKQLENRAFFTRADQLHFEMLGFVTPISMTGLAKLDWLLGMLKTKFERLRDVINWTQQRRH